MSPAQETLLQHGNEIPLASIGECDAYAKIKCEDRLRRTLTTDPAKPPPEPVFEIGRLRTARTLPVLPTVYALYCDTTCV